MTNPIDQLFGSKYIEYFKQITSYTENKHGKNKIKFKNPKYVPTHIELKTDIHGNSKYITKRILYQPHYYKNGFYDKFSIQDIKSVLD